MKEWVILDKAKKYSTERWSYLSPTTIIDYAAGFNAALEMMEKNEVKNLAQPDVSGRSEQSFCICDKSRPMDIQNVEITICKTCGGIAK